MLDAGKITEAGDGGHRLPQPRGGARTTRTPSSRARRPVDELLGRGLPRPTRCAGTTARRSPTAASPSCSPPATRPASWAERPAWIRGIDHRVDGHNLGARDLTVAPSIVASPARRPAWHDGPIDVAELHAPFTHQEQILRPSPRPGRRHRGQPVGRPARRQPDDGRRPDPHRRGRQPHHVRRRSTEASPTPPAATLLQQNLVAVLEGERADERRTSCRRRCRPDQVRRGPRRRLAAGPAPRGRRTGRSPTPT